MARDLDARLKELEAVEVQEDEPHPVLHRPAARGLGSGRPAQDGTVEERGSASDPRGADQT